MKEVGQWKLFGGFVTFLGILAILTKRAGLGAYGRAEGETAQITGILMIILGVKLIFPMILVRKKKPRSPEKEK